MRDAEGGKRKWSRVKKIRERPGGMEREKKWGGGQERGKKSEGETKREESKVEIETSEEQYLRDAVITC